MNVILLKRAEVALSYTALSLVVLGMAMTGVAWICRFEWRRQEAYKQADDAPARARSNSYAR